MHVNRGRVFSRWGVAFCIVSVSVLGEVPFVSIQSFEVFRIDDCILSFCQGYPAVRVAAAQPAIQKHRPNQYAFEPGRDVDDDLNLTAPRFVFDS